MKPTQTQLSMLLRLSRGAVRTHELSFPTFEACLKRGWVAKKAGDPRYTELTESGLEAIKGVTR